MRRYAWILAAVAALTALGRAAAQVVAYDNTTTFSGMGLTTAGTAAQGTVTITGMLVDDITFAPGSGGATINEFKFAVVNFDAASANARPRVRFWAADGTGG